MQLTIDFENLFEQIVCDPRYLENLDYGKPRRGHPEGTVRAHIEELEQNLLTMESQISRIEFWKLKILIHVHDSFKAEATKGVAIENPNSHASLACRFLSKYCRDRDLLAMVQNHDVPYSIWRRMQKDSQPNELRLVRLENSIVDWDLFLRFLIIDGCTMGKDRRPLQWFLPEIGQRVRTSITVEDIL